MDARDVIVPSEEELLGVWYRALASPLGVVLPTLDPERVRSALNRARAGSLDPEIQGMSVCTSPDAPFAELWIVKDAPKGRAAKEV